MLSVGGSGVSAPISISLHNHEKLYVLISPTSILTRQVCVVECALKEASHSSVWHGYLPYQLLVVPILSQNISMSHSNDERLKGSAVVLREVNHCSLATNCLLDQV